MMVHISMLVLSTAILASMVTGCNKLQDTNALSKTNKTLSVEVKDDEVTRRVKVAFANDEKLRGFNIDVVTLKGDVKLTGLVHDQNQIDHAKKIALNIEGAHSIHDKLIIQK